MAGAKDFTGRRMEGKKITLKDAVMAKPMGGKFKGSSSTFPKKINASKYTQHISKGR